MPEIVKSQGFVLELSHYNKYGGDVKVFVKPISLGGYYAPQSDLIYVFPTFSEVSVDTTRILIESLNNLVEKLPNLYRVWFTGTGELIGFERITETNPRVTLLESFIDNNPTIKVTNYNLKVSVKQFPPLGLWMHDKTVCCVDRPETLQYILASIACRMPEECEWAYSDDTQYERSSYNPLSWEFFFCYAKYLEYISGVQVIFEWRKVYDEFAKENSLPYFCDTLTSLDSLLTKIRMDAAFELLRKSATITDQWESLYSGDDCGDICYITFEQLINPEFPKNIDQAILSQDINILVKMPDEVKADVTKFLIKRSILKCVYINDKGSLVVVVTNTMDKFPL